MQTPKPSLSVKGSLPRRPVGDLLILIQAPTMVWPERKFLKFRMPRLVENAYVHHYMDATHSKERGTVVGLGDANLSLSKGESVKNNASEASAKILLTIFTLLLLKKVLKRYR